MYDSTPIPNTFDSTQGFTRFLSNFSDKIASIDSKFLSQSELQNFATITDKLDEASSYLGEQSHTLTSDQVVQKAVDEVGGAISTTTTLLYIGGGIVMLASAIMRGIAIYNYYHPDYDDIPSAMVDVIDTVDGDRYIKYDAVLEAVYAIFKDHFKDVLTFED